MRNKNSKKNTKIYFNNSCSICRFEINHYKKLNNVIDWVDVTQNKVAEKETSKEPSQLIRRLHAKHDGKILEGIDALLIWSQLPRYKWLYNFIKLPLIYHWVIYCMKFLHLLYI